MTAFGMATILAGCGNTTVRGEAPVPEGLEPVTMPAGERVYFDPSSRGEGEMNGNPARTGEFVEVLETNDNRWALRREKWISRCEPQHATKEVLSVETAQGEPVPEDALVIPQRDMPALSYYTRSFVGHLCEQEVMP